MKSKKKKILVVVLITDIILIAGIVAYFKSDLFNKPVIEQPPVEEFTEDIQDIISQPEREVWLSNKSINDDYVGEIVFDSGLINKSFVQATSCYDKNGKLYNFYKENGALVTDPEGYTGNDVYIWTNWKDMTYDYNILGGSVFMDYRNSLNDQNIIIYGHHFSEGGGNDPKREKAFTPLEKLLKKDNYADNKTIKLILNNETRSYELVGVYEFDIDDEVCLDNLQYYRTSYNYDEFEGIIDEQYYDNYIKTMEKYNLYDIDCKLTNADKTLTLQTCISGLAGSVYEICVFKQVDVVKY